MKRKKLIVDLIKEGLKKNTLLVLNDRQLMALHKKMVAESTVIIKDPTKIRDIKRNLEPEDKIEVIEKEELLLDKKPCDTCGIKGCKCVKGVKNDVKEVKKKTEKNNLEEWVTSVVEENLVSYTTKGKIMDLINLRLEQEMAEPATKPQTKPKQPDVNPGTKPSTPPKKNPYRPGPGVNPKPMASNNKDKSGNSQNKDKSKTDLTMLPDFLKFDNIFGNQPLTKPDVKPATPKTKPDVKPAPKKNPYRPGPGVNPKPMAESKKKSSTSPKNLAEMPMEFDPRHRERPHPSIQHNLAQNRTPLTKVPFPKVSPQSVFSNYQELLASERFKAVVEKVKQVTGLTHINNAMSLTGMMMEAYKRIMEIEGQHKRELERLAISLVKKEMALPEGSIRYQATLMEDAFEQLDVEFNTDNSPDTTEVDPTEDEEEMDLGGGDEEESNDEEQNDEEPEEEENEEQTYETEQQLYNRLKNVNLERAKRRLINSMVQGSAKRGHYMYHYVEPELRALTGSDELINCYSMMMAINDLLVWVIPDQAIEIIGMGQGGQLRESAEEILNRPLARNTQRPTVQEQRNDDEDYEYEDEDDEEPEIQQPQRRNTQTNNNFNGMMPTAYCKVDRFSDPPLVKAVAFCFPVLIHELIKGTMLLLSTHGFPKNEDGTENEELTQEVVSKEDVLQKELWDWRLGPAIWNRFRAAYPDEIITDETKTEVQNYLFVEFVSLPVRPFLLFAKEVLSGSAKGKEFMQTLVNDIMKSINNDEYAPMDSELKDDLDLFAEESDDDDEDLSDFFSGLGISLS